MTGLWPRVQGSAAATVAWLLAQQLPHSHDPFFAPIAAFIALNAPLGDRGLNAVRMVLGVIVGITMGELTVAVLSGGRAISMAAATLAATTVAGVLGGWRIVVGQAASAAILTVALAEDAGTTRLVDALVGAGVALIFTQFLFSPEPVGLVRRVEKAALNDIAAALELVAGALEHDDDEVAERAIDELRDMRDRLAELGRVRRVGSHVARRSLIWRRQRGPVVRESENAAHLDLLAGSCLMLARATTALSPVGRRWLAPGVRDLAGALEAMARDLGNREVRQESADRALRLARRLAGAEPPPDPRSPRRSR